MDKDRIEEDIKKLLEKLDSLSMSELYEAPKMQTVEKRLNAKISILINSSLSGVHERLKGLDSGIAELIRAIKEGVVSNKELANESKKYYRSLRIWSIVLGLATICLVLVSYWQGSLLKTYSRETQNLSKIAQEQLDLQLQPALVIVSDEPFRRYSKTLSLFNIGSGAASDISVSCEGRQWQFIDIPDFLDTKKESGLGYIETDRDLSQISEDEIRRESNYYFSFKNNEQLTIRIDYENINNKKYYTKVLISPQGVKLLSRGEIED